MSDIDGTYDIAVASPMGEQKLTMTITTEGSTFAGMAGGSMGSGAVTGTVDGNALTWKQNITVPMPLTIDCTATIDGGNMKGTVATGAFGTFPLTGRKIS